MAVRAWYAESDQVSPILQKIISLSRTDRRENDMPFRITTLALEVVANSAPLQAA